MQRSDAPVKPRVEIALEVGKKRTFATALDWPGWCRAGRDEETAIEALLRYAPRYASSLRGDVRGFTPPRSVASFEVIERLPGSASTEFGAPGTPPGGDAEPVSERDLERLARILQACWRAFDLSASSADGAELSTGPRGGGRDLGKIRAHVLESDGAYLGKLGGKAGRGSSHGQLREAIIDALGARARGEVPDIGPRGGARWSARFAVRYMAWHTLDHAWEIEDRADR